MRRNLYLTGTLAGITLVSILWAQVPLPTQTDFEASEGYASGPLPDSAEWSTGSSGVEVTGIDSQSGEQSLLFPGSSQFLIGSYLSGIPNEITFLDFYLRPVTGPLESLPLEPSSPPTAFMIGFVEDAAGGEFFVTDGDGQSGGVWLPVGNPLATTDGKTDDWVRLTYRINYATKTWDFYLNESMIAAGLSFLDSELEQFEELRLRGGNQGSAGLDFYSITYTNPLFDDADRDGIDDAYELANGMSNAFDDRDGDADRDSLNNLQEYVSGLLAGNADSDNDGVHDGMDEDPAVAGSYDLSPVPFEEDFESLSLGLLDGANRWQSSSAGAVIQGDEVAGGSQALAVSSGAAALEVSNQFDGSDDSKIWLRFKIKPTWWEATTYPQSSDISADSTAVFFFQKGGRIVGYDGSQWTATDMDLDEDAWLEVVLFEDYVTQKWSLWVNNAPVFEGMDFANKQPYFNRFTLKQLNSQAAYLDDFSASHTDSVEVDSDFDGLLDSEEDLNGNGIVDLGETDPHNADTDGDGIPDQPGILMRLWLRADTGVTTDSNGQVTQWSDSRGIGDVTQVDANRQPVLVDDVLAGHPAIRFDGVDDFLAGLSDFDPSDQDFTFLIVQQKSGGHDKAAPLSYNVGSGSGAPLIRWGPEVGQLGINDVDVGPTGLYVELGPDHENKPYVTTFCRSGDTLCVRALGPGQTERAMGTQTWTSGGDGHFYLGKKKDSADHFFGGDILEVRVYQGALREADFLQLESELAARYGVEIDIDDDGLLDSFERLYFDGELNEFGSGDYDGDGIDNLREQNLGLNPAIADAPAGLLGHPDLKLWLRADSGVTADAAGKISAWADFSGNGDIAYQDNGSKQPTLLSGELNGQPAVAFDGVDDYLEALSEFHASGSDFTIIAVQNRTGGHDKAAIFSYSTHADASGAPLLRWGPNSDQFGINDVGESPDGVYVDPGAGYTGKTYVSSVTRSGGIDGLNGSLFLRNSGNGLTSEASGLQTWTSEDSDGFFVARKRVAEDHYFGGSIAEVLVFDSALSPAEIEAIEEGLIAQYGVDADLDRDGLSDAWETQYFGSLSEDGAGDFDQDGVINYREYNLGTNPNFDDNFHFVMARDDLQLWLSAGQGVELDEEGRAAIWRDRSGWDHDALQGSAAFRPSWIQSNIQRQPAVVFDGVNDFLSGVAGFYAASSDYTIVLVHNRTGGHDKAAPISLSTSSGDNGAPLLRWGPNAGQFGINNVGVSETGVYVNLGASNESDFYLSTVRSEGGSLVLTMDSEGQSFTAEGARTWSAQTSGGYYLGKKQLNNTTHLFGGEIAEVLVFSSALSDEDLAQLQSCLIEKYGLTLDRDGDGLTNEQEDLNGNGLVDAGETDSWNPDSDGDGIVDSLDYRFEADPSNPTHVAQLTDVDGYLTWSTSFEVGEGISVGPLGGQDSWMASRIIEVTDTDASDGDQSLSLTAPTVDGESVAERLVNGAASPQIWVSFDAKLAAGSLPRPAEIDESTAALFGLTYSDTVAAFNVETQSWVYAQGAVTDGQWAHYDIYLDYADGTWDLFVNQEFVFEDLPFIDPSRTALERFKAWQSGQGVAGLIDQLVITQAEPAGLDFDRDGLDNDLERQLGSNIYLSDSDGDTMPDKWEYDYGLNPSDASDAGGNLDGDYLTNVDEFNFGFLPDTADTDGDGLNDGYGMAGLVKRERWDGLAGRWVNILPVYSAMQRVADREDWVDSLKQVQTQDNYDSATRIRGFFIAPETRDYQFQVYGNDTVEFYLSADGTPFNVRRIALVPAQVNQNAWTDYPEQIAESISLVAGQKYFFTLLHKQKELGTHFGVGWLNDLGEVEFIEGDQLQAFMPDSNDADDDGLLDSWENACGLDFNVASLPAEGFLGDLDQDGLTNAQEYLLGTLPNVDDTDSDGFSDGVEVFEGTDPLLSADSPSVLTASTSGLTPLLAGAAGLADIYDNNNSGDITIYANGVGSHGIHSLDGGFFQIDVTESFDVSIRIDSLQSAYSTISGEAGLYIRSSLEGDGEAAGIVVTGKGISTVLSGAGGVKEFDEIAVESGPIWLKLKRQVNSVVVMSYSYDGVQWWEANRTLWDSMGNPLVGLQLSSGDSVDMAMASVALIKVDVDTDLDGLFDMEETAVGTSPNLADSDGDGVNDFEELYTYLSDPLTIDIGAVNASFSTDLGTGYGKTGEWEHIEQGAYAQSGRGIYAQPFSLTEAGVYELDIRVSPYNYTGSRTQYELAVSVDGQFVQRINLSMQPDENATAKVVLPWLASGDHEVEVRYENFKLSRRLLIESMTLSTRSGPDYDSNGQADWIDYRLAQLNGIETLATSSTVSPFCLEGRSRYTSMVLIDGENVSPAPGDRWFSDVILDPAAAVDVSLSFENGGLTEAYSVSWTPTNVIEQHGESLTVRKGDSLLLTAYPNGETVGSVDVLIDSQLLSSSVVGSPTVFKFIDPGTYYIDATWSHNGLSESGQIELKVISAEFAESPVALVGLPRLWSNSTLPDDLHIEADTRIYIAEEEIVEGEDRVFEVITDSIEPRYVCARLWEDGPIVTFEGIRGLRSATTGATSMELLQIFEDGSKLYEVAVVQSDVYPEVEAWLDIFAGGVMFEDGSIFKVLDADDFNDIGVSYVRFIMGPYVLTSFCHNTDFYDNAVHIGKPNG